MKTMIKTIKMTARSWDVMVKVTHRELTLSEVLTQVDIPLCTLTTAMIESNTEQ